jgi:hypothetical protein
MADHSNLFYEAARVKVSFPTKPPSQTGDTTSRRTCRSRSAKLASRVLWQTVAHLLTLGLFCFNHAAVVTHAAMLSAAFRTVVLNERKANILLLMPLKTRSFTFWPAL